MAARITVSNPTFRCHENASTCVHACMCTCVQPQMHACKNPSLVSDERMPPYACLSRAPSRGPRMHDNSRCCSTGADISRLRDGV
eukprot:365550-Chlamydomonas_euryale.AAC.2